MGPLWRCCWPVLPPLLPLISLKSHLGGCKHSVSVPSVGIFESNHRHWYFYIMRYTVPTVHNYLGVKIPPFKCETRLTSQSFRYKVYFYGTYETATLKNEGKNITIYGTNHRCCGSKMIVFRIRIRLFRLFRIRILFRILHEMCESVSSSRALRGKLALNPWKLWQDISFCRLSTKFFLKFKAF